MKPTTRYLDRENLPFYEKLIDLWFAPKAFESQKLYERLGVRIIKRYVPTGGDYFIQKHGVRIINLQNNIDSMIRFEKRTRLYEAIHVLVFLGFLTWSARRLLRRDTTALDFCFAVLVYVALILSPAVLQRYNRIRIYRAIQLLSKRQGLVEQAGGK